MILGLSPKALRFWFYTSPADMRKGFDGLSGLVRDHCALDPLTGDVFVFVSRARTHIKLLCCLLRRRATAQQYLQLFQRSVAQLGEGAGELGAHLGRRRSELQKYESTRVREYATSSPKGGKQNER